jgi:hypothetical protein
VRAGETELIQIELIDEQVDDSDGIVFCDVVLEAFGKQALGDRSSPSMKRFMDNSH